MSGNSSSLLSTPSLRVLGSSVRHVQIGVVEPTDLALARTLVLLVREWISLNGASRGVDFRGARSPVGRPVHRASGAVVIC